MNYIDTHAHVFSHEANFLSTARYIPDYTASIEDYIRYLDLNGFSKGVLVQPSFYGTDNSCMLAAISNYPERLKGIAVLDNDTSISTLKHLDEQGIVGVRLNLFGLSCPNLTESKWQNFLKNVATMGWQVEIHAPVEYLVKLLPLLTQYSIDIVIDHFGRFDNELGVEDLNYGRFLEILDPNQHWVKVSAYYRLDNELSIQNAVDAFELLKKHGMKDRLIWGSDWPHTQYESKMSFDKALNDFKNIVNNKSFMNKILTQNNAHLFNF